MSGCNIYVVHQYHAADMDLALLRRHLRIIPCARVFAIPNRTTDARKQLSNRYILQFLRNVMADSYLEQAVSDMKTKDILANLRSSLRKVGARVHGKLQDQQAQMQTYQLFLRELSQDYENTRQRLQSASGGIRQFDNEGLELLIPEGEARKTHKFSFRHSVSSGHLEFDLTTKFPIRHVTRTVTPTNNATWIPAIAELGGHRFQGKLKNSRTSDAVAEVQLFGWKKEIHAHLILRDRQVVQAQTALISRIADSIGNTEVEWSKASTEYSVYVKEMERYESDLKCLDQPHLAAWKFSDMQKVLAAGSLSGVSVLYGLQSTVPRAYFPETCSPCATSQALFAELASMLRGAIAYLQDCQEVLINHFWVTRMALESMQADLVRVFRAVPDDDGGSDDANDGLERALAQYSNDDQGSAEVAQEAAEVLKRLNSESEDFEEKHGDVLDQFGLVDVEAQEEAVASVSNVRKELLVAMEACEATASLFDCERLPIAVFASLEHGNSAIATYISVYEGLKILLAEGKGLVMV